MAQTAKDNAGKGGLLSKQMSEAEATFYSRSLMTCARLPPHPSDLAASPQKMKNIHYAGHGYDLVKGNPQCSGGCVESAGFDPGFLGTHNVIDLTYSTGKITPDGRYLVPDNLDVESAVTCSLVTSTHAVHSTYDYQNSLNVDASVDTTFEETWLGKVQFSASVDYQRMSHKMGASAKTVYSTRAACSVYQASVLPFTTLNLTTYFRSAVATLPATYDARHYLTIIESFGTHYVTAVQMGAKMVRNIECSSSDIDSLTSQGVDVKAAVQVDALFAHVKVGTNVTWHKSDHDQLSKKDCSASELNVGLAPPGGLMCGSEDCNPANIDMSPWQETLLSDKGEPMPMQYTLESIDALLTKQYFSHDPDIAKKQLNLQQFLQRDYCGSVPGCAPPNPMGTWLLEPSLLLPHVPAHPLAQGIEGKGISHHLLGLLAAQHGRYRAGGLETGSEAQPLERTRFP